MDVDVAERLVHRIHVDRARVVHVEHGGLAVGDDETGVADRTVGRGPQRNDHDVESAGPERGLRSDLDSGRRDPMLDGVDGLEELGEAQRLEFTPQIRHRVVRQQHRRVLADVLAQCARIEVILVQV